MTFFDLVFSSEFKWIHNWSKPRLIRFFLITETKFWNIGGKIWMRTFPDFVMNYDWVSTKVPFRANNLMMGNSYLIDVGSKREFRWDPFVSWLFKSTYISKASYSLWKLKYKQNRNNYSRFFILMNTMAVILTNREINSIIGTGAFRFGGHSKNGFFLAAPFCAKMKKKERTRAVPYAVFHQFDSLIWLIILAESTTIDDSSLIYFIWILNQFRLSVIFRHFLKYNYKYFREYEPCHMTHEKYSPAMLLDCYP